MDSGGSVSAHETFRHGRAGPRRQDRKSQGKAVFFTPPRFPHDRAASRPTRRGALRSPASPFPQWLPARPASRKVCRMKPMFRRESDRDPEFAHWITTLPGAEKVDRCIQCGLCSGSCPLSMYMDKSPRRLLHLAKEGFKEDVLGSFAIWLCTSCYACTARCPQQIKVTDIMYAFKRRAIEEGIYPRRFPIPALAREFRKAVRAHGRISETRVAASLNLKAHPARLSGLSRVGWRLMRAGRFSLKQDSIEDRETLRRMLDVARASEEEVPE
jgi:quinone-modifying oxidoreductase subunit QmoC